jgi:hypothetical protein
MPPIRVAQTLAPISITEPRPGVFVVDFGQNFAGWVRIRMQGQPGDSVKLHHSELIDSTGMIDPWTNRQAQATDITIFKGNGIECYEPRFTYHGFRYVEITGLREKPTAEMVEGRVVHADFATEGSFSCSDATLTGWHKLSLEQDQQLFVDSDRLPHAGRADACAMDSRVYERERFISFPCTGITASGCGTFAAATAIRTGMATGAAALAIVFLLR